MPALEFGLPTAFVSRLREIVPAEEFEPVVAAFARDPAPAFWFNSLKCGDAPELDLPSSALDWPPEARTIAPEDREKLTQHPAAEDGLIYIQNASSQAAVAVLDPQPGEKILDLAAAPGGKTLRIAAKLGPEGDIAAVEVSKQRFFRLKQNLKRCGAGFVRTYLSDGRLIGKKTPNRFDAILLDAPCSSEAVIRADQPKTWEHWNESKIRRSAAMQKALLLSAVEAVRPGGRIVYSTCSLAPEENEAVVQQALDLAEGRLTVEPIEIPRANAKPGLLRWRDVSFSPCLAGARRILPDGLFSPFFVCRLRVGKTE